MNFSQRGPGGYEVSFFRMMLNTIDFSLVLNLVLDYYFILHGIVIFFNCFAWFDWFCIQFKVLSA